MESLYDQKISFHSLFSTAWILSVNPTLQSQLLRGALGRYTFCMQNFILATNVLILDPTAYRQFKENNVIIPLKVLEGKLAPFKISDSRRAGCSVS